MHDFKDLLSYIAIFCVAAAMGFFLLVNSRRMFLFIKHELLRRNIVTFLTGICFFFAFGHLIPDFRHIMHDFGPGRGMLLCCLIVFLNLSIPYNIVLYIDEHPRLDHMETLKKQVLIFSSVVLTTILFNGIMNYWLNGSTRYLKYSVAWSFYIAGFGSLIYLFVRHNEMQKKKKLFEKELQLAKLNELKTKAELEALHSKINPHFLYNALNSIADLTVTDGQKARQMTISLADLFRYSINYSNSNYTTVREEIEIARLYLQIEKTRFEDKLVYSLTADENCLSYLVPRFILQPIIENAVKHGLKATGQLTRINVSIAIEEAILFIRVFDNGPAFPKELSPGYGLKTVYDKVEMLFPGQFDLQMKNEPEKYLQISLYNPVKNEPAIQSHNY